MNAASLFVPPDHKVVTIEETREIGLPHENWVATTTRESDVGEDRPTVDADELLSEALHQRPDHILVGELRVDPDVVRTFFQAIGNGLLAGELLDDRLLSGLPYALGFTAVFLAL
ncbi:MAG: ATPase, T2SS/T4P/T4SS family [Halobacteriaceae archaeon]